MKITWTRGTDGFYRTTDQHGFRWHIVQGGSHAWEVYRESELLYTVEALWLAKHYVAHDLRSAA